MRLKNTNSEIPVTAIIFLLILSIIITAIMGVSYSNNVEYNHSFLGFISWIFADGIAFAGVIIIFYALTILAVIKNVLDKKEFNRKPRIQYVNFSPDRIDFIYNIPGCNFSCNYQDIKELEMEIITSYAKDNVIVRGINLIFILTDNRRYNILIDSMYKIKTIYKIIDYTKNVKNFRYLFKEDLVSPDCKEKIEKYINKGYKDFLGKKSALDLKMASIFFFLLYIFTCIMLLMVNAENPVSISYIFRETLLALPILIIVLIIDIILIIDYIRDKNSGRYRNG